MLHHFNHEWALGDISTMHYFRQLTGCLGGGPLDLSEESVGGPVV